MDERSAFEELFRSRQQELFAFLLARVRHREEAKDLLQDVFLQVWRNRATVLALPPDEQGRYLWTMARNRAIDAARSKGTHLSRITHPLNEGEEPPALQPPEEERFILLEKCLADLPEEDRELLLLASVGGMDSLAIAEGLGSNPKTVRSRLSRIRSVLYRRMILLSEEE